MLPSAKPRSQQASGWLAQVLPDWQPL